MTRMMSTRSYMLKHLLPQLLQPMSPRNTIAIASLTVSLLKKLVRITSRLLKMQLRVVLAVVIVKRWRKQEKSTRRNWRNTMRMTNSRLCHKLSAKQTSC